LKSHSDAVVEYALQVFGLVQYLTEKVGRH